MATTVAASAQGCGPTRLKVAETLDLDMPAARAWSLVGDFQNVGWEGSALVSGEGGNRPGEAHRAVKLADGSVIEESLYKYDGAARSLSWHIDKSDPAVLPVQNAAETLEVVDVAGGTRSRIVWRSAFYRSLKAGEGAPDQADAAAATAMAHHMRASLDGLKAKLDPKT